MTRRGLNRNDPMTSNQTVTVFGAYGHTGRFVVSELLNRGWTPILSGRDEDKLNVIAARHSGLDIRPASVEDATSLDRALAGASAVINCAGPFLDTSASVIAAALRARIHYLDVAAEQQAVLNTFEQFADVAREAGIVVVPSMAFYGGLSDLLATAAMGNWADADEISIAIALDSWKPTRGTRLTGQRNPGRRFVFSNNQLRRDDPPPARKWDFPPPFGSQDVAGLSFAETITISRHLRVSDIRVFINLLPLTELRNPDTPAPVAADESGRSDQRFFVDVIARKGKEQRRAVASGRDIYAITAPIVVEATQRVVNQAPETTGVVAAGEIFDARDFLRSLSQAHISIEIQ
jgi:hypothetical protein